MQAYDVFLNNKQPQFAEKILQKNAEELCKYILKFMNKKIHKVLEIGPGKGYFYSAISKMDQAIEYYAMDRNENILSNLGIPKDKCIICNLPSIETDQKFDVIFAGFVIEHLNNGMQLYEALINMKNRLNDEGIIVLQFPDAMKLGMELYNIDYTHCLATTKRNVNQAVVDAGLKVVKSIDLSGILYTKPVSSKIKYYFRRIFVYLYSYKIMSSLCCLFYRTPLWDLQNVFWRIYALIKEPNCMFIIQKESIIKWNDK